MPSVKTTAALALLALPAAAVTIVDPADDPTVGAQDYRDLAAGFPSVGELTGPGQSGSGVLIGSDWVLTAGHIAFAKGSTATFAIGGTNYAVSSSITHPDYSFGSLASDLGLVRLANPVTGIPVVRTHQFTDSLLPTGLEAVWVGYGFTGTGLDGASPPLELRAFTNVIDGFGPDFEDLFPSSFVADFDRPDGSTNAVGSTTAATRLEGNVAPGDSGGGVFVEIDGEYRLIGINSYTATLDSFPAGSNSRYGALSGATNLQGFHAWIAAETGILPVPEPTTLLLLAPGLALAMRRRRPAAADPSLAPCRSRPGDAN